ncbi:MAG TPA: CRTAC1 family protein [Acidobacteriota bacterium]|nr:CRTAC1 family protein [Acidobacteriota bacterium]
MSRRQRLLRRTVLGSLLVVALIVGIIVSRESLRSSDVASDGIEDVLARDLPEGAPEAQFVDRGQQLQPPFRHFAGTRTHRLPEDMGSGIAWGDCNGDDLPDLYAVNFVGPIDLTEQQIAGLPGNALYLNRGDGRFDEVAAAASADIREFGMAAAWGDYDGDGDQDLFVSQYGPNLLLENDGQCSFTDVTEKVGVAGGGAFSGGASWADYDGDQDLDLYVTNYVRFDESIASPELSLQFGQSIPFTLNPSSYEPAPNFLYRNRGDGSFEEVASVALVDNPTGRSLSAAWADYDLDGDLDLYVANDISDNALYRNRGDGTFDDISADSLTADYRGAMGLAVADYDRDGDLDFFVTHWLAQENALYTNHLSEMGPERMMFGDVADMVGLGHTGLSSVGWGTAFLDYDNDGWVDLFVANGSTLEQRDNDELLVPQKMQLFWNRGLDGYYDATLIAGPGLAHPWVARGAAAADWDRDGDVDLAVSVNGGPLLLLENQGPVNGHWIEIDLRQPGGNRRALGALIRVVTDIATQLGAVGANSSYLSQEPTTRHFGVGQTDLVEVQVRWPDGTEEVWLELAADQSVVLDRGTGTILAR